MFKELRIILTLLLCLPLLASAQITGYWQQAVEYSIDVDFYDTQNARFKGKETIEYTNNSPDELNQVFFHLYFNAFQPGSMMDVRSRTILDPDKRVGERIVGLSPENQGYQKIKSLKLNGTDVSYTIDGTVLQAKLPQGIKPGSKAIFTVEFEAQVPEQVRRSGKNNAEGVALSMTQWYPKLAEYDNNGWHPTPYVGREFYGVFGKFKVSITIDKAYTLGGTGTVQNPDEVGHGYGTGTSTADKLIWKFAAENVHDFAWAADKAYEHVTRTCKDGLVLHFLYKKGEDYSATWTNLPEETEKLFGLMSKYFGKYPYANYSVIQGGDGGMEYPMATLITGNRPFNSLVGVTVHEAGHSWYQGVLATDESAYSWMDEGFTSYATAVVEKEMGFLEGNPHEGAFRGYYALRDKGYQEPLSTPADHFTTNFAYGVSSYSMGQIFLVQLRYIIGEEAFDKTMLKYFDVWKFKHPTPNDFIKIAEDQSGQILDWYLNYWIGQTKGIDYAIKGLTALGNTSKLTLKKEGGMPMPLEFDVILKSGETTRHYIPLNLQRGVKPTDKNTLTHSAWPWTHPVYELELNHKIADIESIILFPNDNVADVEKSNNLYPLIKKIILEKSLIFQDKK